MEMASSSSSKSLTLTMVLPFSVDFVAAEGEDAELLFEEYLWCLLLLSSRGRLLSENDDSYV